MEGGRKIAKGLKMVLEERGLRTDGKNKEWMKITLAQHPDFRFEKCEIEKYPIRKGHTRTFLPKFHPELNPIERVWAQMKRYMRAHCNYSTPSLKKNVPASPENIANHFRKVTHFMFGYLEGLIPGQELDERLKKYKTAAKSHRKLERTNRPHPFFIPIIVEQNTLSKICNRNFFVHSFNILFVKF